MPFPILVAANFFLLTALPFLTLSQEQIREYALLTTAGHPARCNVPLFAYGLPVSYLTTVAGHNITDWGWFMSLGGSGAVLCMCITVGGNLTRTLGYLAVTHLFFATALAAILSGNLW